MDRIKGAVIQADVERAKHLVEGIRWCGYQEKDNSKLVHSWDELSGSEVVGKETRDRRLRARGQKNQDLPRRRFDKEIKVVRLRTE